MEESSLYQLIEYFPDFESQLLEINEYMLGQGLKFKTRFRLPFYYGKTWIAYLNIPKPKRKKDPSRAELCFVRGIELPSGPTMLDFKGRAMIGGIDISTLDDQKREIINLLTQEAIELDATVPYTFKKKK
ncbi:MAG: hypothetical protein Kapaf2KO_21860 [Candidatus Kapaibacteriales bacterium]